MFVLHVIASGARRGGEVFASDLIRSLGRYGVEQEAVVLHGPPPADLELAVPSRLLSERLSAGRLSPAILGSLRAAVRELRPDVVHAHGGEALKYLSVVSLVDRTPLVYRRIGAAVPGVRSGLRRVVLAAEMRRAKRVVAVADAVATQTIETFGITASRVVTIPNAVDRQRLVPARDPVEFRTSLGLNEDSQVVAFIGAFTWEKDPLTNLEVALRVLKRNPRAVFVMAGDGVLRNDVEAAVLRSTHSDRVMLLGSRTDIPDILAVTDVILAASRTEGMPANLIEAGMMAVPVVSYAMSGIPEIVADGETGFLLRPGDLGGLEAAVVKLLEHEDLRRSMREAARRRCVARFDIDAATPRYLKLLGEVAAERGVRLFV